MTAIEIKPAAFARGVPKEQHNGFFGREDELLKMLDEQIVAVVIYRVDDDIQKRGKGIRYPVIGVDHIEPIFDAELVEKVREVLGEQYKARTGENQLDFSGIDTEGGEK